MAIMWRAAKTHIAKAVQETVALARGGSAREGAAKPTPTIISTQKSPAKMYPRASMLSPPYFYYIRCLNEVK